MSTLLREERDGHISTLIMSRPEKRNSLTPQLLASLKGALEKLTNEGSTRVAVLRGEGEEAFSAGYDIGRIDERIGEGGSNPLHDALHAIEHSPFPVLAMIHGFCMGGALELAATCDLRLAAEDARLAITPARLGLVYHPQGLLRFINLVGVGYAKELFLTAGTVDAQRALAMGLVNFVVPKGELQAFTYRLASQIASNAPLSVRGIKQVMNLALRFQRLADDDTAEIRAIIQKAAHSNDLKEGRQAFLEKRKPQFQGK